MDGPVLDMLSPDELSSLVCGVSDLDFMALERVAEYEGFARTDPIIKWFWDTVHRMDQATKTKLLLFITGCSKLRLALAALNYYDASCCSICQTVVFGEVITVCPLNYRLYT